MVCGLCIGLAVAQSDPLPCVDRGCGRERILSRHTSARVAFVFLLSVLVIVTMVVDARERGVAMAEPVTTPVVVTATPTPTPTANPAVWSYLESHVDTTPTPTSRYFATIPGRSGRTTGNWWSWDTLVVSCGTQEVGVFVIFRGSSLPSTDGLDLDLRWVTDLGDSVRLPAKGYAVTGGLMASMPAWAVEQFVLVLVRASRATVRAFHPEAKTAMTATFELNVQPGVQPADHPVRRVIQACS